jgi:lysozyme
LPNSLFFSWRFVFSGGRIGMIAIERIIDRLVADEGEVLHAYQDHMDLWTIGVGRLIDPKKGGGISREESRYLLANDIRKWLAIAGQWTWFDKLSWQRQGVLVCMLHQLGARGVSNFRKMLEALEKNDFEAAADEMLDSAWYKQTPARCELMAQIMRTGEWQ